MFERLEKYRDELARAKARRADLDAKIKELERKCKEEENAQIHGMVHAMNMTPEQLQKLLTKAAAGKLFDDEEKAFSGEEVKEDETDDCDKELMEELGDEDKD